MGTKFGQRHIKKLSNEDQLHFTAILKKIKMKGKLHYEQNVQILNKDRISTSAMWNHIGT